MRGKHSDFLIGCKIMWLLMGYKGCYVGFPDGTWRYRLTHVNGFEIWF